MPAQQTINKLVDWLPAATLTCDRCSKSAVAHVKSTNRVVCRDHLMEEVRE